MTMFSHRWHAEPESRMTFDMDLLTEIMLLPSLSPSLFFSDTTCTTTTEKERTIVTFSLSLSLHWFNKTEGGLHVRNDFVVNICCLDQSVLFGKLHLCLTPTLQYIYPHPHLNVNLVNKESTHEHV